MPTNFLTLPRELRDIIYELCLLTEEPVRPLGDTLYKWGLTPGILGTNKTIYNEARLFLYQNRFDFTKTIAWCISSFAERIGRHNADCVRHVYIDFPEFNGVELGNITIKERYTRIIGSIQGSYANLKTLMTSRNSACPTIYVYHNADDLKLLTETLTVANTHFRAISSLQDIIIEVYKRVIFFGPLEDLARKQYERQGWTIIENGSISE
ncbi:hypothetical protein ACLOAV_000684 [Pseudogymnoascus australis]